MIWLCGVLFLSFITVSESFEMQQAGINNLCSWNSSTILRWPTNNPASYWECNIGYLCQCWCPQNMVFDNRTLECQFLHLSSPSEFSITPTTTLHVISTEMRRTPRKLSTSKEQTTNVSPLPHKDKETETTKSFVRTAASSDILSSTLKPSLVSLNPTLYPKVSTMGSRAPSKGCIKLGSNNLCSWNSSTILRWSTNNPTSYWECNIGYLFRCWCPQNMVFDNRTLECQFSDPSSPSEFSKTPTTKLPVISSDMRRTPHKLSTSKEQTTNVSPLPHKDKETETTKSFVPTAASSDISSSTLKPSLVSLNMTLYPTVSTKRSRALAQGCIKLGLAWFCPRNLKQRFHWSTSDPRQYWECSGNTLFRCWCPSKHVFQKETMKCHFRRV
ncbi:hypothetical protein ACJMK2_033276 [Sinanodonta woodiana]|uniref:Uncharacterized protein n=1 Tax=Sinanodonta woodiana TaxID=1069815 RepID=A0ABD3WPB5_SINWO